jgi:hypothetical protein
LLPIAALAGLLAGSALAPPPARAELFRCKRPDGSVTYTDDAAACPGAVPHATKGEIQRVPRGAAPAAATSPATTPPASFDSQAGEEAAWRQRAAAARAELADVERREVELREYVTACNRGATLLARDDAGLNHTVSCDSARGAWQQAQARRDQLRQYLAVGLQDECRRSGCLPGWIR